MMEKPPTHHFELALLLIITLAVVQVIINYVLFT